MSYKNLKELGISPHSYINKRGTERLDKYVREANDLVYEWQFTYLSPLAAEYLASRINGTLEGLRGLAGDIKGTQSYDRWLECGNLLVGWSNRLRTYISEAAVDRNTDNKVIRRLVSQWVSTPYKNDLETDEIVRRLETNKLYSKLYNYADCPAFTRMQEELLQILKKRVELGAP